MAGLSSAIEFDLFSTKRAGDSHGAKACHSRAFAQDHTESQLEVLKHPPAHPVPYSKFIGLHEVAVLW